jgi:hypothetical protein
MDAVVPLQPATSISPLVPLVGVAILLTVLGATAIFLPPYLLSLQTHKGKSFIIN